jgi:hypothetical protein
VYRVVYQVSSKKNLASIRFVADLVPFIAKCRMVLGPIESRKTTMACFEPSVCQTAVCPNLRRRPSHLLFQLCRPSTAVLGYSLPPKRSGY